jgi:hypothetical protein
MPVRRRPSTALIDDPEMPGANDLDQDVTPAKRTGRPRKTATAIVAPKRRGRPPGSGSTAARDPGGRIMSVQQMKDEVAGELAMVATLLVAGLEMRDEDMAAAILEPVSLGRLGEVDPIDGFTERVVNLLARYPKALAYAAKGGALTDIAVAATILVTVGKRCAQVSSYRRAQGQGELDGDQFPAYAGTAA